LRNRTETLNPLPLPPSVTIRNFSYQEIAVASSSNLFADHRSVTEGFSSVIYKASFGNDKATVTSLNPSTQNLKEFVNEVNTLASLQHPNICKVIGYHAREGSDKKMLVYERLFHGSLDRLLHGRSDGPPVDWNSRMKLALCAAQGLAFLHEEGPFQAMFHEFSTANIQIEKDFSAKLSGYGFVTQITDTDSTKPQEKGLLTPKSNVWSFGIVLLELLTGRKNLDNNDPKEERNLIKWSWPYLSDESRLSLIVDPRLKGRFPANAARLVADIVQRCLKADPSERPTMRTIVNELKVIQEMKNTSLFPIHEPGKNTSRWPSLDRVLNIPPAGKTQLPVLAKKTLGRPSSLPPRISSSIIVFEEIDRQVLKGF
jgi:serine/threonine protein kinase